MLNKASHICSVTRRSFLGRITLAGIVALIGGWFAPVAQAAQKVKIPLNKVPKLNKIKGGVILKFKNMEVLLIRTGKKTVSALSPICTHEQCTVQYKKKWGEIRCPCHGSRYTVDGRVTEPPAEKNLKKFLAKLEGDTIILDLDPPPADPDQNNPEKIVTE